MIYGIGFLATGTAGFLVGLLAFKVKSRWCPECGSWTWRQAAGTPHSGRCEQ